MKADVWWYATYTFNIRTAFYGWPQLNFLNHYWSLAIEEQYYLIWPFVVLVCGPRLRLICVFGAIASALSRIWLLQQDAPWYTAYTLTFCRLDGLLLGSMAATLIDAKIPAPLLRKLSLWGALMTGGVLAELFLLFGEFNLKTTPVIAIPVANAHFTCWILVCATSSGTSLIPRMLACRPLRGLGQLSYGIYLFHAPVLCFLVTWIPTIHAQSQSWLLTQAAWFLHVLAASTMAATITWFAFEKWFLSLKRYFPTSAGRPQAVPNQGELQQAPATA